MQEISDKYTEILNTFILAARNAQKKFPNMLEDTLEVWQSSESFFQKYYYLPYLLGSLQTGFILLEDTITKDQQRYLKRKKEQLYSMKVEYYKNFYYFREEALLYQKFFSWLKPLDIIDRVELSRPLSELYGNGKTPSFLMFSRQGN
ncbi:hypothetical protein JW877_07745 [bacterium]|nr:hypothetical protein [bacterium]